MRNLALTNSVHTHIDTHTPKHLHTVKDKQGSNLLLLCSRSFSQRDPFKLAVMLRIISTYIHLDLMQKPTFETYRLNIHPSNSLAHYVTFFSLWILLFSFLWHFMNATVYYFQVIRFHALKLYEAITILLSE